MATANANFHTTDVNKGKESGEDKYNGFESQIGTNAQKFSNVAAPTAQAATINTGNSDQDRASQLGFQNQLQQQALGNGPSLAKGILQQGADRTLAGQAALAASAPSGGSNPALAARQLQTQAVLGNQNVAQQASQAKVQEQLNAQAQLGGVLNNTRAQDIGIATSQAGLNQQTNLANQDASIATNGQNLQGSLGFTNALGSAINSDVSGQQFVGQQAINQDQFVQQQQAAQAQANAAGINGAIGGAIGAAGDIATGGLSSYLKPPGK